MRPREALIGAALAAVVAAGCGGGGGSTSREASRSSTSDGGSTASTTASRSTTSTASTGTSTRAQSKPPSGPAKKATRPRPATPATPAATVEAALTSARCDLYTPRLLDKSYGGLAGCRAASKAGGIAKSVEVRRIQPEGRFALVVAEPRGGPSSGEKLAISLVKEGGAWRLEAIHSNVKVGP